MGFSPAHFKTGRLLTKTATGETASLSHFSRREIRILSSSGTLEMEYALPSILRDPLSRKGNSKPCDIAYIMKFMLG